MATTILLHSQKKVTACVCLECTQLQRHASLGGATPIHWSPMATKIIAALPSSKVSEKGHTALNPCLTALQPLSHKKFHILFKWSENHRVTTQAHSNAKANSFQPTWVK